MVFSLRTGSGPLSASDVGSLLSSARVVLRSIDPNKHVQSHACTQAGTQLTCAGPFAPGVTTLTPQIIYPSTTVVPLGSPSLVTGTTLYPGHTLVSGSYLCAADSTARAYVIHARAFVVLGSKILWHVGSPTHPAVSLIVTPQGALVVRTTKAVIFATHSFGPTVHLQLSGSGHLQIVNADKRVVWSS